MKTRKQFRTAAAAYIRREWKKHKNLIYKKDPPNYPASIAEYLYVTVDGKRRYFCVCVRAATDFSKR
jgi:hypothetical protein